FFFFFSSRSRHTRSKRDWSSDVCSSDLFPGISTATVSALKAVAAMAACRFKAETVAVEIPGKKGPTVVEKDECPRADTTLEALEIGRAACRERVEGGEGEGGVAWKEVKY